MSPTQCSFSGKTRTRSRQHITGSVVPPEGIPVQIIDRDKYGSASYQSDASAARACITSRRNQLFRNILAPSSTQTYKRAWALYIEFATLFGTIKEGLVTLPISVYDLSLFIAFLDNNGLPPATVMTYVSAVGFQHKCAGVPDPTGSFVIQKLLRAVKYNNQTLDTRLPITEALLIQLSQAADFTTGSEYNKQLIRCMMSLAFWGFFRIGELTSTNCPIKISDITFSIKGGEIIEALVTLHSRLRCKRLIRH
jgi:hypothetical protein